MKCWIWGRSVVLGLRFGRIISSFISNFNLGLDLFLILIHVPTNHGSMSVSSQILQDDYLLQASSPGPREEPSHE